MASTVKKQLLIAYNFPPLANAESIVTAKMVRGIEEYGWKTTVCSVNPLSDPGSEDHSLMSLLPNSVEIIRTNAFHGGKLLRIMRRLGLKRFATICGSLPDQNISWYPSIVSKIKKLTKKSDYRVVQSRAFPITNHLVGFYAKRKLGLPWLAHFSDPWIDSPYYVQPFKLLSRLHAYWERLIIGAADQLTFSSDAACQLIMSKYPAPWRNKCHVVHHGFMASPNVTEIGSLLDRKKFNIVYLGNFYGKRTPLPLFRALKIFSTKNKDNAYVRIWLIGRMPHQEYSNILKQLNIDNLVCLINPVSYYKAIAYARQADLLLTIDTHCSNSDIFLESKLIEYLGFNKPILGICFPNKFTASLLRSLGCPVGNIENPLHIAHILTQTMENWKRKKLPKLNADDPKIQQFRISNIAGKIVSIFENMISENSF